MDLDLKHPSVNRRLGLSEPRRMTDFLTGREPSERFLLRVQPNLALGVNQVAEHGAAEVVQNPQTAAILERMTRALRPEVLLFDLPPLLAGDQALALLGLLDAVLLIGEAGRTMAADLRECERLLEGGSNLLGVVLNKDDPWDVQSYAYDY